jgi:hypothetical protein
LGIAKHPYPINAETRNVSREGLSVELEIRLENGCLLIQQGKQAIQLIPFLVLNEKLVDLDIQILPGDERVRTRGGLDGMTLAQRRNYIILWQVSSWRKLKIEKVGEFHKEHKLNASKCFQVISLQTGKYSGLTHNAFFHDY